ncbi:UNVERIFIED_CONTAM: RNA cytidine acetyltransferase 1 [Sesamum latifolium]|uniref:RNA cytidine acetyltransferase 1 n=1 Tax=Sesamum latifolium TaxID=2727402 RepID=A0AAW2VAV1_9LAMI
MADAPAHHLFVLLGIYPATKSHISLLSFLVPEYLLEIMYAGPVDKSQNILPDLFCVIQHLFLWPWRICFLEVERQGSVGNQISIVQVCLEGEISREAAFQSLRNGHQPAGDQIPWKFCEEFENTDFPMLSGVRIVRIAVHPSALGHGYGSAALDLLTRYYEGQLDLITEEDKETKDKQKLPGNVTQAAAKNNITGEHSCMVLKPLEGSWTDSEHYLSPFYQCFRERFARSLPLCFREMDYKLAMSIMDPKINFPNNDPLLSLENKGTMISPNDFRLLEAYTSGLKDYGKVRNLVPLLAQLYFQEKLPISLSYLQASILLCMGLQLHDVTYIEGRMKIEKQQILSLFRKTMIKFSKFLSRVLTNEFDKSLPKEDEAKRMLPHSISLEDDLDDGAKQVAVSALSSDLKLFSTSVDTRLLDFLTYDHMHIVSNFQENMKQDDIGLLDPRSQLLEHYTLANKESEFEQALRSCSTISESGLLSVKSKRAPSERVVKSRKDGGSKNRKRDRREAA